ncbi:hypothetical protein BG011_003875 [Mortierella polycephala]|uniref:Uncharacterized protein n=1 Tax=Mortierella polycephala TaxID=41804 RepID=A0A9P6U350_9FUNG|nr:hypothetical protein BG011_003875 [Mortierella polycephala]
MDDLASIIGAKKVTRIFDVWYKLDVEKEDFDGKAPAKAYVGALRSSFPLSVTTSRLEQREISQKRRCGEVSGMLKEFMAVADQDPDQYGQMRDIVPKAIRKVKNKVLDPTVVKTKGAPKKEGY